MRVEAREAAYVEFVTARQTYLRRIAYALCGDWEQADEILQAALVRLYVAWPRVQREGAEESYVRRIIVGTSVDPHRGSRRPHPASDRSAVLDALQSLPSGQRKTVVLHHWLGLSIAETADELGISTGRVRSHSSRALASLRDALSEEAR
jgi:DNA-directed RNA polymerase specialized sigma24 family protein